MVLVVMGVSGSGKTTVAEILAAKLGWGFEEGDSLHPQSNIDAMRSGQPLNDESRRVWIDAIAKWVEGRLDAGESGIITCSALKRSYRAVINRRGSGVIFVFLAGTQATIAQRLAARQEHFMPLSLLDSQFDTLENPGPDEPHIRVDIGLPPTLVAQNILRELGLSAGPINGVGSTETPA
jgi:gluconokinase